MAMREVEAILEEGRHVGLNARRALGGEGSLLTSCFRLRHRTFVEERRWVDGGALPHLGLETDAYDPHALHFATVDGDEVAAYLRVLPYQPVIGFMLHREFAPLCPDGLPPLGPGDAEVSRLAVAAANAHGPHPVELLLRELYREAPRLGLSRFFIVVECGWLRAFRRRFGLPFREIGSPHVFADGTRAVAAVATLEEMEEGMRRHDPAKYDWYRAA